MLNKRYFLQRLVAVAVIAAALLSLVLMQSESLGDRLISKPSADESPIVIVRTQRDAYFICKGRSLRGAAVVSLGKFFNLQYWIPEHLARSTPFPIQAFDIRSEYEQALESHNWLFIANRTGMVRKVFSVLSPDEFRRREQDLKSDYALARRSFGYEGFQYDLPRNVTTLAGLRQVDGPVVVIVDASYFGPDVDPVATARQLAERLPSTALFIVVSSLDEDVVTWAMRSKMAMFIRAWQESR